MRRLANLAALVLLSALAMSCASKPFVASAGGVGPEEAILRAARAEGDGVRGVYSIRVRTTGRQDGEVYLNSELDYRDQRNLTIALRPAAAVALEARFGRAPDRYLRGKRIEVDGLARRVRIDFLANGQATGKYYFQTHVAVDRADQLRLAEAP